MKRATYFWIGGGLAIAAGAIYGLSRIKQRPASIIHAPSAPTPIATTTDSIRRFVDAHKDDPSPVMQDRVGNARIRLGYLTAHEHPGKETPADYEAARKTFEEAASAYKGKPRMGADFGGVPDAAEYQAIACLSAEHKDAEAETGLRAFMKDYPLSPLCEGAYKRLVHMNGGKATPELDGLLQQDENAQQKHIAFETSVCGPKAIEALLPLLGKPAKDYKELAKLCGTTDKGTTVVALRKALQKLGLQSYAVVLNPTDFAHVPTPAILLQAEHYTLIKQIKDGYAIIFDPTTGLTNSLKLPKSDDPNFLADVITFSTPTLGVN